MTSEAVESYIDKKENNIIHNKMNKMFQYVHYANNSILFITAILTFILLVYSLTNNYEINTWQFPMMMAMFLDGFFLMTIA